MSSDKKLDTKQLADTTQPQVFSSLGFNLLTLAQQMVVASAGAQTSVARAGDHVRTATASNAAEIHGNHETAPDQTGQIQTELNHRNSDDGRSQMRMPAHDVPITGSLAHELLGTPAAVSGVLSAIDLLPASWSVRSIASVGEVNHALLNSALLSATACDVLEENLASGAPSSVVAAQLGSEGSVVTTPVGAATSDVSTASTASPYATGAQHPTDFAETNTVNAPSSPWPLTPSFTVVPAPAATTGLSAASGYGIAPSGSSVVTGLTGNTTGPSAQPADETTATNPLESSSPASTETSAVPNADQSGVGTPVDQSLMTSSDGNPIGLATPSAPVSTNLPDLSDNSQGGANVSPNAAGSQTGIASTTPSEGGTQASADTASTTSAGTGETNPASTPSATNASNTTDAAASVAQTPVATGETGASPSPGTEATTTADPNSPTNQTSTTTTSGTGETTPASTTTTSGTGETTPASTTTSGTGATSETTAGTPTTQTQTTGQSSVMTAVSQSANESSPHHGEALWHLLSQTDAGQTVTTGASESCSVAGSSSGQQILAAAATTLTPVTGSLQSPANQVCAPDAGSMPSQQGESTANSSATVTPTATAAQTQSQADWWHGSHPAETSQLATEASVSAAFGSSEPSAIAGNPNCPQTAPVLASATIPEPASPQTTADQVSAPTAGASLSATSADGSPTGVTGTPSTVQTTPAGVLSQVPDTEQASSATMTPNLSFSVPHSIVYQDAGPGVSPQLASILHQHLASIQPNAIESPLDNYTGGDALSWTPTPEFEQANVPHVHAPETFPVHGDTLATDHAASAQYHFDAHG